MSLSDGDEFRALFRSNDEISERIAVEALTAKPALLAEKAELEQTIFAKLYGHPGDSARLLDALQAASSCAALFHLRQQKLIGSATSPTTLSPAPMACAEDKEGTKEESSIVKILEIVSMHR